MSHWIDTTINLGTMQEKTKRVFAFNLKEGFDKSDVIETKPSCASCTSIVSFEDNELVVVFASSTIPQHLSATTKSWDTKKYITVQYKNGETETLTFTAKILKNKK